MEGWSRHQGRAVALPLENIDTDQIIPARFMSTPRSEGYGRFLLHDLRRDASGELRQDMPLNRADGASLLVTRRNFGGGSSREAAVYALVDAGFRAVIAPGFGDIFAGNAVNNGLLPARVTPEAAERLIAALGDGTAEMSVDIKSRELRVANLTEAFDLDETWAKKLINGWDDISLTQAEGARIGAFREKRREAAPWVWAG